MMLNATKFLRVVSRLPRRRYVSTIRPKPESSVVDGVTYTKMLAPHTLTAWMVNYHWKLYWEKFVWFRFIAYSTMAVMPLFLYTNYHVFKALYANKRAEKRARKEAKKAGKAVHH